MIRILMIPFILLILSVSYILTSDSADRVSRYPRVASDGESIG